VKTRTYGRFSDAVDDIVDARIYEGIHFRSADEVARRGESRTRRQPDVKPFPPAAPLECEHRRAPGRDEGELTVKSMAEALTATRQVLYPLHWRRERPLPDIYDSRVASPALSRPPNEAERLRE
jgi:hypothetical protein